MPKLAVSVPHSLGQQRATELLKERFHSLKEHYHDQVSSLEEEWEDHSLSFRLTTYGVTVKGRVTSGPSEVTVKADLPLVAVVFKSAIEKQISEHLAELLV